MPPIRITLVQADLHWEDIQANLSGLGRHIRSLGADTDLIVLPEMFATGFSMEPSRISQAMDGPAVDWMRETSRRTGAVVTGSLAIHENENHYNRLLWVDPEGRIQWYDKKHLFRMSGENKVYTPGDKQLTVTLKKWRIRPFICYDLRFPLWLRNVQNAYDLALVVANWPAKRAYHWQTLLLARAIENQVFVLGVNRVGSDGNHTVYSGDSMAVDPLGRILARGTDQPWCHTLVLDPAPMIECRRSFPVWMDADLHDIKG